MTVESTGPRRRSATEVPEISGLRLLPPGTAASLVNISSTGLLAESDAKVRVGAAVQVQFEGAFPTKSARGRVVRCEVSVMGRDGLLRYHTAVEFDAALPIDEPADIVDVPAPASKSARNRW